MDGDDSTKHSKPTDILLIALTVLNGGLAVVAVKVPWKYFTTRGISPCRDVDYHISIGLLWSVRPKI